MPLEYTFFWSGPFSQWHPSMFTVDGETYTCAEQYMMAEKARLFGDTERERLIMSNTSPDIQKSLGRQVTGFDDVVWKRHARDIVLKGNLAKFSQNPDLLAKLLATGDTLLVEASPEDVLWGIGLRAKDPRAANPKTWRGKNWLGETLTKVRDTLKSAT